MRHVTRTCAHITSVLGSPADPCFRGSIDLRKDPVYPTGLKEAGTAHQRCSLLHYYVTARHSLLPFYILLYWEEKKKGPSAPAPREGGCCCYYPRWFGSVSCCVLWCTAMSRPARAFCNGDLRIGALYTPAARSRVLKLSASFGDDEGDEAR